MCLPLGILILYMETQPPRHLHEHIIPSSHHRNETIRTNLQFTFPALNPQAPTFHVPIKGAGWDSFDSADPSKTPDSGHFWHKNADRMAEKNGWIVQQYMQDPLLVSGRKFDIRCYCLLTLVNGDLSAYFFRDMYVRTSSKKYSLSKLSDREAHLTNDAVQKGSKMYGKFEYGNKLTMEDLQVISLDM